MLTNLKKLMALSGAIAVIAMNLAPAGVSAAGLNGNTLTTTSPAGNIIITSSGTPFVVGATVVATVNGVSRSAAVTSTSVITVTDPDGSANATVDAGNYSISITEDQNTPANAADDVFFSVVYNTLAAGTAGSNQVLVTARVVPTLSMAIANGSDGNQAIAFGTLTPGTFAEDDITLTYASNAVSGVNIAMTAGGLKDTVINREVGVTSLAAQTDTAATDYYKVSTNAGGTATVAFDTVNNALNAVGGADMAASQNVVTTAGPSASTNQLVTVGTQVAANTEAGNYSDTLTFTITGSF